MVDNPTLSELLGAVIVLGGILFSAWALIDDAFDLLNVWRFGEVGGPRWYTASGHFMFNLTILGAWVCFAGVIAIAIYLPSRTDQPAETLSVIVGWLRLGYAGLVLFSQVHLRAARFHLQRLPLAAWERMVTSMFDGLDVDARAALLSRLFKATAAGREMGHLVAGSLQLPVGLLEEMAADKTVTPDRRAEIEEAITALQRVSGQVRALHAELKALEAQVQP